MFGIPFVFFSEDKKENTVWIIKIKNDIVTVSVRNIIKNHAHNLANSCDIIRIHLLFFCKFVWEGNEKVAIQ